MTTMMKTAILTLGVAITAFSAVGCASGRTPEAYRDDTEKMLSATNQGVTDCYTNILKTAPTTQGSVTVHFVIQEDSGALVHAKVDKARSTAPETVQQCVTGAIQNLHLTPADAQRGEALFTWDFTFKEPQVVEQPADKPAT